MTETMSFSRVVGSALFPLLEQYGFGPCQADDTVHPEHGSTMLLSQSWSGPVPSDRDVSSALFCGGYDQLPGAAKDLVGQPYTAGAGHCVDIVVKGTPEYGITSVEYECRPLDEVLDDAGLSEHRDRVESIPSGDLVADVAIVRDALAAMFSLSPA